MATTTREPAPERGSGRSAALRRWLMQDETEPRRMHGKHPPAGVHERKPWWRVMCLTGVDYFSTLGYQPGIAALAAGLVSPIATIVLVLITLCGALPVYRRVAKESPHGQGSIAMLERHLSRWKGKLLVLALLGFAATDFVITMTLSAADATAHALQNPLMPSALHGQQVLFTLLLLAVLGAVFLRGFGEAVGVAVVLVGIYLALNVVVVAVALQHVLTAPQLITDWKSALLTQHGNPWVVVGIALVVFPKLALGLSGFETGVAVMPLVKGHADDDPAEPAGTIRNTRRLLTTAALIMSVFLILSSFITTLLIPQPQFEPGGAANGRALALLAHDYLGPAFGTAYDLSTIAILWFAGASAMAGLLNLVPRYLPRYGMAPDWARALRPLVLVFTVIAFAITLIFDANVDKQGGAYATGVLVLISSAAVAVTLSARRRGARKSAIGFGVIAVIMLYTTGANIAERPEGVKIAVFFIGAIILTSLVSRATRSTELRVSDIEVDRSAAELIAAAAAGPHIRIIASDPGSHDEQEYARKEGELREDHHISAQAKLLFLEASIEDASEFTATLRVRGEQRFGYRVLCLRSATVPNAIAALLLHIRDETGQLPHIYFAWMEGNPVLHALRFLLSGDGDVPPMTREVLRRAEPDPHRRPYVHVG